MSAVAATEVTTCRRSQGSSTSSPTSSLTRDTSVARPSRATSHDAPFDGKSRKHFRRESRCRDGTSSEEPGEKGEHEFSFEVLRLYTTKVELLIPCEGTVGFLEPVRQVTALDHAGYSHFRS